MKHNKLERMSNLIEWILLFALLATPLMTVMGVWSQLLGGSDYLQQELIDALLKASRGGLDPIYCDTSPCTLRLVQEGLDPRLRLYDPVKFIREHLLERLEFTPQDKPVAVHVTCSTQHLGEAQGLIDIARRCSTQVVIPEGIHCCGFAGDKGFTRPELNAHALRSLKDAVQICEEGISTSRTCEIGLSTHSGIDYHGLITTDRPTTTKLRVIGGHQQMMRLDFEESAPITGPYADRFLHYINQKLNESLDCVIISDYGKGSCTEQNCQKIIQACHAHGVPVVVDPKGTNWAKYAHADYITPNLKEINAVLLEPIRNEDKAVEKAAHYVMRKFKLRNVIVTRSEEGLSLVREEEVVHIPTKAQEVFDVSGAGDTCVATVILALAAGVAPATAARLSNIASGIAVRKLGTSTVSVRELAEAIEKSREEYTSK